MRDVTSIEELAIEEGMVKTGREDAIEVLATRLGEVPNYYVEAINAIDDPAVLKTLLKRAIAISSIEQFQQVLDDVTK